MYNILYYTCSRILVKFSRVSKVLEQENIPVHVCMS